MVVVGSLLIMLIVGLVALSLLGALLSTDSQPGADVSNVSVTAADARPPDSRTSLLAEWNARAQSAVDPQSNDLSTYRAPDGEKFLVVRMTISHMGGKKINLRSRLFQVIVGGVIYDPQLLFGAGNSFNDVTLTTGSTYSGWIAYSIPEGTRKAQLSVSQDIYYDKNVSVRFSHNPAIPINMSG